MATQEIPVQFENPNYEQRTRLSGKDFLLRFRYQERDCFWYLRISDTNGNVIVGDTRIIANLPLLSTVTDLGRPAGEIICIDLRPSAKRSRRRGTPTSRTWVVGIRCFINPSRTCCERSRLWPSSEASGRHTRL